MFREYLGRFNDFWSGIYYRFAPPVDVPGFDEAEDKRNIDFVDFQRMSDDEFRLHSIPSLRILDEFRQLQLKIYKFRRKIGIPLAVVFTPVFVYLDYLLLWLQRGNDDGGAGLTFAFLGALYWWVTQPKRHYARGYKMKMLPRIAKMFGDFKYDLEGKIDMDVLEPSGIIPNHHKYKSEDYFEGQYKGVEMQFSEIQLKERRGSGKNRRYVTVFKGLAILMDMKSKKFLGHTILDSNKSSIGEWFKEKSSSMKRARMADPKFEKMFDAYTNDQVEARYLIDPLMIEDLKTLQEEYEGEQMTAAWYDSKMLILIASKHNHFEPADIFTPATNTEELLSMKHEVSQILSLVDRLQLFDPRVVEQEKADQNNGPEGPDPLLNPLADKDRLQETRSI